MIDLYTEPADLKMGQEPYMVASQDHHYGPDQVSMAAHDDSPRDRRSPQQHYSNSFNFSLPAPSSFDPTYSGASYHTSFSAPQPLQPLNTTAVWPSQLTNPSPPSTRSPPTALPLLPRPVAPIEQETPNEAESHPSPPAASKATTSTSTSRRTLTDNDRRRMCRYHEENPTVKQTDIGAMFGVERSTVSKVLRNKEKYLKAEEGRNSPPNNKKFKSKFPDIERTLSNWARKRITDGQSIDDEMIKEEARKFASTLDGDECNGRINDPAWLEKFKQKNQLPGAKSKKLNASTGRTSPKVMMSPSNGPSPTLAWDGTSMDTLRQDKMTNSPGSVFDESNPWGHVHSQSTVSMSSLISDPAFSNDFRSPTSPSFFIPTSASDPTPGKPVQKVPRLPNLAPAKLHRRQTVPIIKSEDVSPNSESPENAQNRLPPPDSTDEMEISPIGIDTNMHDPTRPSTTVAMYSGINSASTNTTSPFSMYPPSTTTISTNISPSIGSTTSPPDSASPATAPSQDEARAALMTLKKFMEHQPSGAVDPHDYLVMGKWMQILRLDGRNMPGGMYSIPMSERADGTAPMGRKRSEHSLS